MSLDRAQVARLFHVMILAMNKGSLLLLFLGFLVGFLLTYLWVRQRDLGPIIIRDVATMEQQNRESEVNTRAFERLQEEIAANPNNFQALVQMGNMNFDSQNYLLSTEYYSRALELRPDNVSVSTDLGTALYYADQIEAALAAFERSLSINPSHPQTLFNMGVILLEERNDKDGAIELWERLIQTNANYPQIGMVQEELARLKRDP